MRNFLVPQSTQVDRVAATAVLHRDGLDVFGWGSCLALDAVNLHGFGRGGHSWTLLGENGCRHCNPPRRLARPAAGILVTLAPYVPKGKILRRLPASRFREGRLLEPQGGHRPGKCGRQLMAIHIVM